MFSMIRGNLSCLAVAKKQKPPTETRRRLFAIDAPGLAPDIIPGGLVELDEMPQLGDGCKLVSSIDFATGCKEGKPEHGLGIDRKH